MENRLVQVEGELGEARRSFASMEAEFARVSLHNKHKLVSSRVLLHCNKLSWTFKAMSCLLLSYKCQYNCNLLSVSYCIIVYTVVVLQLGGIRWVASDVTPVAGGVGEDARRQSAPTAGELNFLLFVVYVLFVPV